MVCVMVCVSVCVCAECMYMYDMCAYVRTYVARGVCLVLYVSMLDKCTNQSM